MASPELSAEDFQRLQVRSGKTQETELIRRANYLHVSSLSLSQEALLELKTKNYSLEDQCRKQKSGKQLLKKAAVFWKTNFNLTKPCKFLALGEAQAKVTVLEQELGKSQKIIQKSKKASEVQVMEAWFLQEGMYRTRIAPLLCRL